MVEIDVKDDFLLKNEVLPSKNKGKYIHYYIFLKTNVTLRIPYLGGGGHLKTSFLSKKSSLTSISTIKSDPKNTTHN